MHPICTLSNHHLLPLAVYAFFGLEYLVKYEMCLVESDSAILTEQKTRVTRKFAFGFGQTRTSTEFSNACIVENHTKNK